MVFKKGHKPTKKVEQKVVEEVEVKEVIENEEETAGTTVLENEIMNEVKAVETNAKEEKKKDVIGKVGGVEVHMTPSPRGIKFETYQAVVPMFMIKDDELRQYLINHGFGTDLYRKDKEWLEKHNADMKMVERLKKYLTGK